MSRRDRPDRPLAAWPCQSICVWTATADEWVDGSRGDLRVFRCDGCGSEWVRTEGWTPVQANGHVSPEVSAERRRG